MPSNRRFIEDWLPIKEIGVESRRENSTGQHPPPNRLHVWWARRPLVVSRAAILGALLPAWNGNEELLKEHFSDEEAYQAWFKRLIGILGDPVAAEKALTRARNTGVRIENPNKFSRAFTMTPDESDTEILSSILNKAYGTPNPTILDPMAGGGSIPFESLRLGFNTIATDLNPVASTILKATLEFPMKFGGDLIEDIRFWGNKLADNGRARLVEYFPEPDSGEIILTYIWARTVPCPSTGKPVPLSPTWWLRRQGTDSVAVHLLQCESDWDECRFQLVRGTLADLQRQYDPDQGTIKGGAAISPWTGDPISSEYIKEMAKSGKFGAQLYALYVDQGRGRDFRLPNNTDLDGAEKAEAALNNHWDDFKMNRLIPIEEVPPGTNTDQPRPYGMTQWYKMFAPRQLLAMVIYLDELKNLRQKIETDESAERAKALITYLAMVLDKLPNYNSLLASWHASRAVVRSVFDTHDLAPKMGFAEMNMAMKDKGAFPWALQQVVDAYRGLCNLLEPSYGPLLQTQAGSVKSLHVDMANATRLSQFSDGSVDAVVFDPPYGGNVMYAELSDFFYVWLKRSVGDLYPDWFKTELTEKNTEAVANPAQFKGAKGKPKELATRDYLLKMRRVFREMRRVIKPDGSMVVMFTHKETDMWNALGLALLETDWKVGASWPVHTESEHSLQIARKNSAKSTILLFCHPRTSSTETTYFDEAIRQEVRSTVRSSAQRYQEAGIDGVDLYLATYGPVLGVLSKSWPILSTEVDRETGEQKRLEPEEALNIARREVFDMRKEQLVQGRPGNWDAVTEWYILAWDAARTREVSFDVAHKLALSSGIDAAALINQHRILAKKGDAVRFLEPKERFGEGRVDPAATSFSRLIDVLHTALYLYQEESDRACRRFLDTTGHLRDPDFASLVEAALNAIPRTRRYERGKVVGFLLPEAQTLENMRVSMFPDIEAPHEVIHEVGEQRAFDLDDEEDEEDEE